VFLLILGIAYAGGVWRRSFAWLTALSKGIAAIFLVGEYLAAEAPRQALLAAAIDGVLGLAVAAALACELWPRRRRIPPGRQ
jgi:hypothetical protein